jgi:hypothetical protein
MSNDSPLRLRVADEVRPGVFATDLLIFSGGHEFVLDFVQNLEVPIRVVARVVVPRPALAAMVAVMHQGVSVPRAQVHSGSGQEAGAAEAQSAAAAAGISPPTTLSQPKQVYDDIKLPEAVQSGAYANALITAHNDQIFRLDFVAQFCPEPVLTARVFVTKAQAAQVLAALEHVAKGA